MSDPLIALAEAAGLQPHFFDAWGRPREVSRDTLRAVLDAFGLGGDPAEALALYRRRAAERLVPPAIVLRRGRPAATLLMLPAPATGETVRFHLRLEDGHEESDTFSVADLPIREQVEIAGTAYEQRVLPLRPNLPFGYHQLSVHLGERSTEALVIAAPDRIWAPWRRSDDRVWGLAVQLYGVRSSRNWGIGDFTDLAELIDRAGAEGAATIGVNPLHALFPDEPERVSPYSPSTRLYRNPLYLDIEAIPDLARSAEAQALVSSYEFQRELGRLRAASTVAYAAVATLKRRVLRLLFTAFERSASTQRRRAFARYRADRGPSLRRFAIYERLRELRSAEDWSQRDWRNWPSELQDPDSPAVAAFAAAEEEALRFIEYQQWQIDEQLAACRERAARQGMPIGLYADIAVGVDAGGAEAWWNQAVVVRGLGVGAPPDVLNLLGQDWGLPLFNPVVLAERAFAPFIAVLRANMRHAGAIRIDHILGLMRLWCIPSGHPPADGAYLTYPVEDLIAITALESHRNHCLVIGEDLGTLPPGLDQVLAQSGILSYRVLYFEQEDGKFRSPAGYRQNALVTVGTHDLPPLARWWHGDDITLRRSLELLSSEEAMQERANRTREVGELAAWAGAPKSLAVPPVAAIHGTLARTPSRLMIAQFEDMLPEATQVNLPGTTEQHPNWRHKLPADLPALFADRRVVETLGAIAAERSRHQQARETKPPPVPSLASPPRATYRLQFNADFTFADALSLVPYLAQLGISHVYASSIFRARPGSSHGYDITDHATVNPEIGTEDTFKRLAGALREAGIGIILDFVPNHMGIGRADNDWWLDVLEWGIASPYAKYFDIDWRSSRRLLRGKILLPFLGDQYGAVLGSGQLELRFDSTFGTFSLWYAEHRFPIRPADYPELLRASGHAVALSLADGFADLPSSRFRHDRDAARERAAALKRHIANLVETNAEVRERICETVQRINDDASQLVENSALHRLVERQHYRLAFWRIASDEINYRRFFDINELAGIRVEEAEIFQATHRGVARLIAEGEIQGLRLDHIDGLAEPLSYLRRLVALSRRYRPRSGSRPRPRNFYLVVEKILGEDEHLRRDWPIHGTTGYEFANLLTWLFVDPAGRPTLDAIYRANGGDAAYDDIAYDSKTLVMETMLASELTLLSERLDRIAKADISTRDYSVRRLRSALAEIVAGMDVYRTYVDGDGVTTEDRRRIAAAAARARRRWHGTDRSILDFLERILLEEGLANADSRIAAIHAFVRRFQQYTGPVMAKSAEDTAFYRYNRLIALNEVGGDPTRFGLSPARFHEANLERALRWPDGMLGTSSHDTKRGEDARLRIAALTEMAEDWSDAVARWTVADLRAAPDAARPDANDAYYIYQTLIGAWPAELVGLVPGELPSDALAEFAERLRSHVLKALREAKRNTSWTDGNQNYESAAIALIDRLLDPTGPFLADFLPFQARAAGLGAMGSIAQAALKLTVPGMPDFYQGAELWNLAMADPDNRRPIDYAVRQALLNADSARQAIDLSATAWRSGSVKLAVTRRLLALRRERPDLFARGRYRPLDTEGAESDRAIAFIRRHGDATVLVMAGRLMGPMLGDPALGRPSVAWRDLSIRLPGFGRRWRNLLTGREEQRFGESASATDLMDDMPVGLWFTDEA